SVGLRRRRDRGRRSRSAGRRSRRQRHVPGLHVGGPTRTLRVAARPPPRRGRRRRVTGPPVNTPGPAGEILGSISPNPDEIGHHGGVGTRILTVEDDERIRTAVKMALEDEGWVVEEADNGEDALDAFNRHPTDVVLIDIMLPGIDGFEVCRSIRRNSDVPIVMVTARADTHDVVAGLEAGAHDYLT